MAFKVNYGLERAERNRAKQAKKEAKAQAKKMSGKAGDAAAAAEPVLPEEAVQLPEEK